MVQGKMKVKAKRPDNLKLKGTHAAAKSKKHSLKKGNHNLAPKKARLLQSSKTQGAIEKEIRKTIEKDMVSKAVAMESRTLKIVQQKEQSKPKEKSAEKKKKK